ncbi:MAG: hypothetical protein K0U72_14985 [Gammaproteobacteria bacterium]|nr:hypothetical protein [Gammaproteobacteria bacterium]
MTKTPDLRVSIILLILANLIPVAGVLLWDWDVFFLLLLFWCENVIIGVFGIARIVVAGGGLFMPLFFCVHYGGFMFGHLMILFGLFAENSMVTETIDEPEQIWTLLKSPVYLVPVLALFVSHGWSFVNNFLLSDERHSYGPMQAMGVPYKRIAVTHVALIAGGFALSASNEPMIGLLLLLAMKISLDVMFHRKEHEVL